MGFSFKKMQQTSLPKPQTGKQDGRECIKQCYLNKGILPAIKLGKQLIKESEHNGGSEAANNFKGEVAETVLHCYLRDMQKTVRPSIATHGLCFPSVSGTLTTEIDVAFFAPSRLYLFECKCFSGEKQLIGKGTLKGKFSTADVYTQSVGHLALLYDYIGGFLDNSKVGSRSPVQLVLFDGGLGRCRDTRDEKAKRVLQYVSFDTLDAWFKDELAQQMNSPAIWDLSKIAALIKEFQKSNDDNIVRHLKRLQEKRG